MTTTAARKTPLKEGMRENDLADLVLPLISVDEYVSKIDPTEAIVIGLYVHEESAAKDLNRFLQKSPVPLLGTDVSPAPDQHGYYMVFVELMNNDRLAQNLEAMLHEMGGLVDVETWQMRVRGIDRLVGFTPENLEDALKTSKHESKKTEVVEFLQRSALNNAEFEGQVLVLEGSGERYIFDFVSFDQIKTLLENFDLRTGMRYDFRNIAKNNRINSMLGEQWDVSRIGAYIMLHRDTDPRGLLLRI